MNCFSANVIIPSKALMGWGLNPVCNSRLLFTIRINTGLHYNIIQIIVFLKLILCEFSIVFIWFILCGILLGDMFVLFLTNIIIINNYTNL